ncbi:Vesicle transport v-SNARE protein vti1 [Cyphellophora attinorum]|uniref:Vesicle transport v-SNARE protein vti1 n=1 Tax=Cyphellophora attinorum TaxID=1664694 RepID=A0A0N1H518_9EURO|nr:Vesicle transport v-SNARE protein vti1 [Phialophora attinorum]KPI40650.1 Vesicle transport v-SNARE protein vti1 [Phialophora attinorum]
MADESQFDSYEGELKLVFADLQQKLDALDTSSTTSAEERKSSIRLAERALEEAKELLDQLNLSKSSIPTTQRTKVNARYRNHASDLDGYTRKLKTLKNSNNADSDRAQLFGERYTDDPNDAALEQRQQLLSGTERLGRSGERLRESQRIALETEAIGAGTLADLHQQRNVIENTHRNLLQSEGYVDRSVKTLRGMARR